VDVSQVGVFPLVKNKPEIMDKARAIHDRLKKRYNVFFDASGAIGRRYDILSFIIMHSRCGSKRTRHTQALQPTECLTCGSHITI
jgi:hypothetical protein